MDTTKQINIKNRTYYFYNDIIDIENFDANLLKFDKKSWKDINIFDIGYVTKKKISNCKNSDFDISCFLFGEENI